jgi:hypothetical protein
VEDNVSRDVRIAWLNLNSARERRRAAPVGAQVPLPRSDC